MEARKLQVGLIGTGWIGQHHGRNVIASGRAELAAVCNPDPDKARAFVQRCGAAAAGKHIYLEKPMAIRLEDCRRIVTAVRKAGVKLDMGYHRRLNPIARFARQLLADGKLGDLVFAESDYFHHVPEDWDIWAWAGKKDIAGTPIHGGTGHNIDLLRSSAARWPR